TPQIPVQVFGLSTDNIRKLSEVVCVCGVRVPITPIAILGSILVDEPLAKVESSWTCTWITQREGTTGGYRPTAGGRRANAGNRAFSPRTTIDISHLTRRYHLCI